MDVAVDLAVLANDAEAFSERGVVSDDRSAVSERAEILRWVEAEATHATDRSGAAPTELRSVGLRTVLDHLDARFACNGRDRIDVSALAVEVNRDDCACPSADRRAKRLRIHGPGLRLDIAQDRCRPGALDRCDRWHAGVRLCDDLVPRPYLERPQGKLDRVGAGGDANSVVRSAERGELGLEGRPFLPQDEPTALEHPCDRGIDLGLHSGGATRKVVERHRRRGHERESMS